MILPIELRAVRLSDLHLVRCYRCENGEVFTRRQVTRPDFTRAGIRSEGHQVGLPWEELAAAAAWTD